MALAISIEFSSVAFSCSVSLSTIISLSSLVGRRGVLTDVVALVALSWVARHRAALGLTLSRPGTRYSRLCLCHLSASHVMCDATQLLRSAGFFCPQVRVLRCPSLPRARRLLPLLSLVGKGKLHVFPSFRGFSFTASASSVISRRKDNDCIGELT
eukprot:2379876-Amphidinium_carterae.1